MPSDELREKVDALRGTMDSVHQALLGRIAELEASLDEAVEKVAQSLAVAQASEARAVNIARLALIATQAYRTAHDPLQRALADLTEAAVPPVPDAGAAATPPPPIATLTVDPPTSA